MWLCAYKIPFVLWGSLSVPSVWPAPFDDSRLQIPAFVPVLSCCDFYGRVVWIILHVPFMGSGQLLAVFFSIPAAEPLFPNRLSCHADDRGLPPGNTYDSLCLVPLYPARTVSTLKTDGAWTMQWSGLSSRRAVDIAGSCQSIFRRQWSSTTTKTQKRAPRTMIPQSTRYGLIEDLKMDCRTDFVMTFLSYEYWLYGL